MACCRFRGREDKIVSVELLSGPPERSEPARVMAEAMGLHEMYRPGL